MLFASDPSFWDTFYQYTLSGLTIGMLIALVALGYTMVYGIIELINFAHGDLFMLGSFLALTIVGWVGLESGDAPTGQIALALVLCFLLCPLFCGLLNVSIDRAVYKPLRTAPKLAPLVSAIGVSFVLMNIGLFWGGPQDVNFPALVSDRNLMPEEANLRVTWKEVLVFGVTIPLMIGLSLFVKFTPMGKAMRATAQNPTAAALMGINTQRVIGATFAIGGALAGAASVVYALTINTVNYTMGYTNGLFAFTAAVLGGIGNIPGAVMGGLLIGLVRAYGSAYIGERWSTALIFAILIVVLVFRPSGLLGSRVREKV